MLFEFLPTELVASIFFLLASVKDVLSLSATCRRFRNIYLSSRRIPMLIHAAETQYGPLLDATQLLTHNGSQPAHAIRTVPFSVALIKQIVHVGGVVERWADLYPFKKWKHDFANRRLLTAVERRRVRRALYRLWLYNRAFYNWAHAREARMSSPARLERTALLHNWSTPELAEMADAHAVLRDVVRGNVCPSNGAVARRFKKRFPDRDQAQLLFNFHLNYPPPLVRPFRSPLHSNVNALVDHYHHVAPRDSRLHDFKYTATPYHEPGAEGWGDDIPHYYVVEDMLKLDPEQILWLKENAPLKGQVEIFVRQFGDWFENNGETWTQTLECVLHDRGDDVQEFWEAIALCESGIAVAE